MHKQLVIRICHPQQSLETAKTAYPCQWGFFNEEGQWADEGQGQLAELHSWLDAQQTPVNPTVSLIVPGQDVLLTEAEVAARSAQQRMQAIPYVIEEQLATDIETVHIALGRSQGNKTPTAVVEKTRLEAWLALLEEHDLHADQVVPDYLCLNQPESEHAHVVIEGDLVLVREGTNIGTTIERDAWLVARQLVEDDSKSWVISFSEEADQVAATLVENELAPSNSGKAGLERVETSVFAYLAQNLIAHSEQQAINLLQGQYATRASHEQSFPWLRMAKVASFLLGAWVLFELGIGVYYERQAEALNEQAVAYYRELFPSDKQVNVYTVKDRMKVHLRSGGQGGSGTAFLELLSYSVKPLSTSGTYRLEQLRYAANNNSLTLSLNAPSVQDLDQYQQTLEGQGLSAKIMSANERQQGVVGRLLISAAQ